MDYGKSGAATARKKAPRHIEHNAKGSGKNPFGEKSKPKAELLKRLKAAAKKG
ncbi:MAG: hypothetical protein H6895_11745 [Defluviimonas sp.]|uniref:hypothetical protein n=1 Tax=Albidovulum sp. TaxID=1872424 RepID=UPI001DA580B9|nr:hypothetical protein [Paracoccaceae bacterium]MCC0064742.1 hypothetical protein [Defluviimonas sp.]